MSVDQELFGDRLPTYLTRFVGRDRELAELTARSSRLVTLCGVGGIGKTRLAIEVAKSLRTGNAKARYDDVYWVSLGAVADPTDVPTELAVAVGVGGASGTHALQAVINALRDRSVLLVLDNCEHVAAACREAATRLLSECPRAAVLTTSRIALDAPGEQVYAVSPLGAEAIDLFVDRAVSVAPAYALTDVNAASIEQICDRLEGLPLAIELAASWVRVVSPRDLLERIAETIDTDAPGAGVEPRHRNLHAVLDSSWQWLNDHDRSVLTGMGVFRGGFTRHAAESVAGADLATLATLAERALIQRLPDAVGGSRYHLHELVHTFAAEQLEARGVEIADDVRARHFDYYLALAESFDTPTHTVIEPTLDGLLGAEQGNLDAALAWAFDQADAERCLRMLEAIGSFYAYYSRTSWIRQKDELARALALPWAATRPSAVIARAKAVNRLGHSYLKVDVAVGEKCFREGLELFTSIDDRVGMAASVRNISYARFLAGDFVAAERYMREGLAAAQAANDTQGEAWCHFQLGLNARDTGDLSAARSHFGRALTLFEGNGGLLGAYWCRYELAEALRINGSRLESLHVLDQALDLQRRHRFTWKGAEVLECLALTAGALHRFEEAARLAGASATWRSSYDEPEHASHRQVAEQLASFRQRSGDLVWDANFAAGERMTRAVAEQFAHEVIRALIASVSERPAGLTEREVEVLQLVAGGLSNAEIAERLVLSPRTVHAHLRSIFGKLEVTTRTAAAHEAVQLNLV